jgi:hypothetical protein
MDKTQVRESLRTLVARNEELAGKVKEASDNDDAEELELAAAELVDTASALAELCQAVDTLLEMEVVPAAEPQQQPGD